MPRYTFRIVSLAAVLAAIVLTAGYPASTPAWAAGRTLVALNSAQMVNGAAYSFTLSADGQVCATHFVPGPQDLVAAAGPVPGHGGTLVALVTDTHGTVIFDAAFTATGCATLALPAGRYDLRVIRWVGVWRLEVSQNP